MLLPAKFVKLILVGFKSPHFPLSEVNLDNRRTIFHFLMEVFFFRSQVALRTLGCLA